MLGAELGAAAGATDGRYRYVVFTAPPARPLNLGRLAVTRASAAPPRRGDGLTASDEPAAFLAWLFREANLCARDYRGLALRRRLPACFRRLRVADITAARRVLRRNPELIPLAVDGLLLGVTEFFRDTPVFDCLAAELPALWLSSSGRPLRVWSAACSDGAELYSVAMLLSELGLSSGAELLGTDCRAEAIARARAGSFAPLARCGLSDQRLRRHFDPPDHDGRARVAGDLREGVAWRQRDVLSGAEPGPWDVILCRNLAMYLRPSAAESLWSKLAAELRPGGLLVLGKAERPAGPAGLVRVGPCIYRRDGSL